MATDAVSLKISRICFHKVLKHENLKLLRREEIIRKYPKIKELFGIDPSFKYVVVMMVVAQFMIAWMLKGCHL